MRQHHRCQPAPPHQRRRRACLLCLGSWLLLPQGSALAAEPEAEAPPQVAPIEPVLPVLIDALPPVYPAAAAEAGEEAVVRLAFLVGLEGEVLEVEVSRSAGAAFDAAAVQAAWSTRFEPARDATGQPAMARVEVDIAFRLEASAELLLDGRVRSSGQGAGAVPGAELLLRSASGEERSLRADEHGVFAVAGLAEGTWTVQATAPGFLVDEAEVDIRPGVATSLELWLRPLDAAGRPETAMASIDVVDTRLRPEVTERRLSAATVEILPGSGGDLVRSLQSLPGVARTPFGAGQLLVRGTSPEDSRFFLDGVALPQVFHFGGFSTVVDPALLDEVVFLPGGYGVRYGEGLGGMVDLRLKTETPEESQGRVSVDLFQVRAQAAMPVAGGGGLWLGARQSHLHLVLNPIVNLDPSYALRVPRYADAHLRYRHQSDAGHSWSLLLLGSEDRFELQVSDLDQEDGWATSAVRSSFLKARLGGKRLLGEGWQAEGALIGGPEGTWATYDEDAGEAFDRGIRVDARLELNRPVPEAGWVGWRMGAELAGGQSSFVYDMSALDGLFPESREEGQAAWWKPAVYLEQTQRGGRFTAVPGLRLQGRQVGPQALVWMVDPRLSGSYGLSEVAELRGSVGQVSQSPELRELTGDLGVGSLLPERAIQATLGWQHSWGLSLSSELTAFHTWLQDLVSGHEDRVIFALSPPPEPPLDLGSYASEGKGRVYGVEAMLRLDSPRTTGWIAATWSRSLRTERAGEDEVPFSYDQPLVLQVLLSQVLGRGWQAGGRFRFGSGNPHTPISNNVLLLDDLSWLPVYDTEGSGRLPPWWALDLRVDKTWPLRGWSLRAYLDLQNATNRTNVELVTWSRDYTQELVVSSLPLLPIVGLEAGW